MTYVDKRVGPVAEVLLDEIFKVALSLPDASDEILGVERKVPVTRGQWHISPDPIEERTVVASWLSTICLHGSEGQGKVV